MGSALRRQGQRVLGPAEFGLQRLLRQYCWNVSYSRYFNLSMSLGSPTLHACHEPRQSRCGRGLLEWSLAHRLVVVRGQWWLWVQCAYWSISEQGSILSTTSSSARRRHRAFVALDGQKLVDVRVAPRTGATMFGFDLGAVLKVRRFERSSSDILWHLHKPSGYVIAVRGDGTFDHGPASGIDKRRGREGRSLAELFARPLGST